MCVTLILLQSLEHNYLIFSQKLTDLHHHFFKSFAISIGRPDYHFFRLATWESMEAACYILLNCTMLQITILGGVIFLTFFIMVKG